MPTGLRALGQRVSRLRAGKRSLLHPTRRSEHNRTGAHDPLRPYRDADWSILETTGEKENRGHSPTRRAGGPGRIAPRKQNNIKVYIPEIREAAIEPPALFTLHGKQAGRWNFSLRDGKKMRFEFENSGELKAALDALPRLLNATLRVNVEWNEIKKRFQKIKPHH